MKTLIETRVRDALGIGVRSLMPLGGGCVGDVRRGMLDDGRSVVVKQAPGVGVEGRMLGDLRGLVPVPEVLFFDHDLLVMAYVEHDGRLGDSAQRHAGELLAGLHDIAAPRYGYIYDTPLGGLAQPNGWDEDWVRFFSDRRVLAMGDQAASAGRIGARTRARIGALCDGPMRELLGEAQRPGLIHGDVWSGNVLGLGGRIAAFIDPAVCFADPELELAFITLFGTFGRAFFDRYQELRPIREGFFECRRDVYNLYPLLVHARLFGGGYERSIIETLGKLGL